MNDVTSSGVCFRSAAVICRSLMAKTRRIVEAPGAGLIVNATMLPTTTSVRTVNVGLSQRRHDAWWTSGPERERGVTSPEDVWRRPALHVDGASIGERRSIRYRHVRQGVYALAAAVVAPSSSTPQ